MTLGIRKGSFWVIVTHRKWRIPDPESVKLFASLITWDCTVACNFHAENGGLEGNISRYCFLSLHQSGEGGGEGRKEEWKWYENELDVLIGKSEGRQIEKSIQPDVCKIPHQQQPEPDCTAYTEVCSVNN